MYQIITIDDFPCYVVSKDIDQDALMSEDNIKKIFTRYFREDNSNSCVAAITILSNSDARVVEKQQNGWERIHSVSCSTLPGIEL